MKMNKNFILIIIAIISISITPISKWIKLKYNEHKNLVAQQELFKKQEEEYNKKNWLTPEIIKAKKQEEKQNESMFENLPIWFAIPNFNTFPNPKNWALIIIWDEYTDQNSAWIFEYLESWKWKYLRQDEELENSPKFMFKNIKND